MSQADRKSRRHRVVLISAGAGLALAAAAVWIQRHVDLPFFSSPSPPTLRNGGEMRGLLEERSQEVSSPVTEPVWRGEIPEEEARRLFAMLGTRQAKYDPLVLWRRFPDLASPRVFEEHPGGGFEFRTNSLGLREDAELPENPDARVLVLGDSHTDGVCENRFSFPNQLERLLGERYPGRVVDVVNAGVGGYSFLNFAGALEKYVEALRVDVVVVAVYCGNDFLETLAPRHFFERTALSNGGADYALAIGEFQETWGGTTDAALSQGIQQLAFLSHVPAEGELAVDTAQRLTRDMAQRADELGVDLVFACFPTAIESQLELHTDRTAAELAEVLGLEPSDLATNPWTDRWLTTVQELDLECIDLRESWSQAQEDLFWHQDHHINLAGHRRLAEALIEAVAGRLDLGD